jgi:hypothetical protein
MQQMKLRRPAGLLLKTIWGAKCEVAKPNEETITYQFEFASSILKMFSRNKISSAVAFIMESSKEENKMIVSACFY